MQRTGCHMDRRAFLSSAALAAAAGAASGAQAGAAARPAVSHRRIATEEAWTIPEHLVQGVASHQYEVFGSVIKEVATGHVAGHLIEAAPLASIMMFGLPVP